MTATDLPPALWHEPAPGQLITPCSACSQYGRTPIRTENGTRVLSLDGPLCVHCHGNGNLGTVERE